MCAFRSLQFSAIVFAVFSRYSAIFYNFLPFPVTLRTSLYLHNFKFSNKFYSTSFNNPSIFSKSSTNNSYKQKWNNFIISNDVVVIVQYNILKITFKIILHTFLIFYLFYAENLHKKKKKKRNKMFLSSKHLRVESRYSIHKSAVWGGINLFSTAYFSDNLHPLP